MEVFETSVTNRADGEIVGGRGSRGGEDWLPTGKGGTGLVFRTSQTRGVFLRNSGIIRGGDTHNPSDPMGGASGAGGVGLEVHADGMSLINAGEISGGRGSRGIRARAVTIYGSNNTLELQKGYSFVGNVVSSGSNNTLLLGGYDDAVLDMGQVGALGSKQFQGFSSFRVDGGGVWTLTGSTDVQTPWFIYGKVVAGEAGAFGMGEIMLGDATVVADFTGKISNNLHVGAGTETTITATEGNAVTFDGHIQNPGPATLRFGASGVNSTVILAPTPQSTLPHDIHIDGGVLQVGDASQAGSPSAPLSQANVTVAFGAVMDLNGSPTELVSLSGAGTLNLGTASAPAQLILKSGDFAGAIKGAGGLEVRCSMPDCSGTTLWGTNLNTYFGETSVEANATLAGGATNVFSAASAVVVDGTLDLGGFDQAIGSLAGGGSVTNSGATAATLTVGVDNTSTNFSGMISGASARTALRKIGSGTLTLSNKNFYFGGATIEGGTLKAGSADGLSETYYTINGGTLDLDRYNLTILSLSGTGGTVEIGRGAKLSVFQSGTTVYGGKISGTGDFVKTGRGTLELTGDSSDFAGWVRVLDGALLVGNGAKLSSPIYRMEVSGAGTIGGSGTLIGDVMIEGTLSAGSSPGTLTIEGRLNLGANSTSLFELSTPGIIGGANDLVVVNGDLTLGGTLEVNASSAGYYRLFNYRLALAGDFTDVTGFAGSMKMLKNIPGQVNLSLLAAGQQMQFWDGADASGDGDLDGGAGTWNATGTNWTGLPGQAGINDQWRGSVAVIGAEATPKPGVITVGSVADAPSFDTIQFASGGYVLSGGELMIGVAGNNSGNAAITGSIINVATGTTTITSVIGDGAGSRLNIAGSGTLILTGSNTYSGGTAFLGGTVQISSDANLGNGGGLAFDGGRLATTASFGTARAVSLGAGGGGFDVAANTTLDLTGSLTGAGNLVKSGDGTLTLSGVNSYGGTSVQAGMLVGNASSISGDIANAGRVVFDQATDATFGGNIVGFSSVRGSMVKRGGGDLTLGGTSALDWTVEGGQLISAAGRFRGNAAITSGAGLSFEQSADETYAGVLSGSGAFAKSGLATTVLTGNSSDFTGMTTVSSGRLVVGQDDAGSLGGSLVVRAGGELGGTGSAGSIGSTVTIASGGVHAPGNSVGTQAINGNYANHGVLRIEGTPAATDRLVVAGGVDITGATLDLLLSPATAATWDPITGPFTLIDKQSAGKVTGTFGKIANNLLFLAPGVDYAGGDGNDVTLKLERNSIDFASAGVTANQIATADAVDMLAKGNPLWNAVALSTDAASARSAFDQLSGEVNASVQTALIEDGLLVANAVNDRIRGAFEGTGAVAAPVLAYGDGGLDLAEASTERFAAWGTAFGSWGGSDGDGNAAALDRSTGGLITGFDGYVTETWRLGVVAGYSRSSMEADARRSSVNADNYHLGLYGGGEWGALGVRAGLTHSWSDVETNRSVAFPGFSDTLAGSYDAGLTQLFGEVGYVMKAGEVDFEPFGSLAYAHLRTDGFTEQGGAAALSVEAASNDLTFATLGLRASTALDLGGVKAAARGMVGWRHAFGDVTPFAAQAFAGSQPFTIAGTPLARDSALLEAGLDFAFSPATTLGLAYQGQLASGAQDHGVKANLALKF